MDWSFIEDDTLPNFSIKNVPEAVVEKLRQRTSNPDG